MDEYISKKKLYEKFFNGTNGIARIHVSDIDTFPKEDVQPIIYAKFRKRRLWDKYVCSNCSFEQDRATKYCPECGAKIK